ncbi:WhiB family transcription factor [Gordonia phage Commandaria]|uniref:WhiB family transcription factor n=1 Tax=Gordonia phage Commandaria TaxID=3038364 RepID=A0AAF0GKR9_9CAUD|nr:WhiB family transcription factor [Gordonia phage Commandaria]WGH20856.1 WhiB family transcription factor [Gordonia phage Commandaria]
MARFGRASSLSVTGRRIARSLSPTDPKIFAAYAVEENPAMAYDLPDLPRPLRDWQHEGKPCDWFPESFVPSDGDDPDNLLTAEQLKERTRLADLRNRKECLSNCRFLDLCSRDALAAAQAMARHQGSAARICGTWAGVTFTGREGKPQYERKLDKLVDQIKSGGRIPWEPLSSNQTTLPSSNESKPSELEMCGQS